MPSPWPLGETVTVLRPGAPSRDAYGNDVPGPDVEIDIEGCAVAPRDGNATSGNEKTQARDQITSGFTVWPPPGSDIQPTDRMRVRGVVCEVDGEAGQWQSPFTGTRSPDQVSLNKVTG